MILMDTLKNKGRGDFQIFLIRSPCYLASERDLPVVSPTWKFFAPPIQHSAVCEPQEAARRLTNSRWDPLYPVEHPPDSVRISEVSTGWRYWVRDLHQATWLQLAGFIENTTWLYGHSFIEFHCSHTACDRFNRWCRLHRQAIVL